MRFFCLTSITAEKDIPDTNADDEIEYQNLIKAGVEVYRANPKDYERFMDEEIQNFKEYVLTEIEIGFDESYKIYNDDGDVISQKLTYLFMIRRNDSYFEIRMEPETIKIINIDWKEDYIIDLDISKENIGNNALVKSIRIRDIKNTPHKEMKDEDYQNYGNFLNQIKEFCDKNSNHSIEDAFETIKLERTGTEKSLKQTMRAVRDAIIDLCDPKKGSPQNVPANARYKSKKPIDWGYYKGQYNGIYINTQKDYHRKKIDTKSEWNGITFKSIYMEKFHNEWFDAVKLTTLEIINCNIADTSDEAWTSFAHGIEKLQNLKIFKLQANLSEIPDIVYEKLSTSLERLYISKNRLICTSFQLYRLINLIEFDISDNQIAEAYGILWNCLPENIKIFNLSNSGVIEIPGNIVHLSNLYKMDLTDTKLENVDWPLLCKSLRNLHFGHVQNLEQIKNSTLPRLKSLTVSNALYTYAPTENLPITIEDLLLPKNYIEYFNFNLNMSDLTILDLSNNNLKIFPWEFIPASLRQIDLSHNELERMGFMQSWIKLTNLNVSYNKIKEFDCDFDADAYKKSGTSWSDWSYMIIGLEFNIAHNCLRSLPSNFETFTPLRKLDISYNKFHIGNKNLNQDRQEYRDLDHESSESGSDVVNDVEIDLNERLWNRLPKKGKLKYLNLSGNHINSLPCKIKDLELVQLDAIDCNLEYICPQISRKTPNLMFMLNISMNPKLKNLTFLPKTVLPPPFGQISYQKIYESPKPDFTQCFKLNRSGETENPNKDFYNLKIITDAAYPSTEKSKTFKTKLFFDFKEVPNKKIPFQNSCKCCANCGELADERICEQLMTMDFEIYENGTFIKFYEPGTWKSKVQTKLCKGCKKLYKDEAEEIVVSSKRKAEKNLEMPSKIMPTKQTKINSEEPMEQEDDNNEQQMEEKMQVDAAEINVGHQFGSEFLCQIQGTVQTTQSVNLNEPLIFYQEPQPCNFIQIQDETGQQRLVTLPPGTQIAYCSIPAENAFDHEPNQ